MINFARFMLNSLVIATINPYLESFQKPDYKGRLVMSRRNIPTANNPSAGFSTLSFSWSFVVHDLDDRIADFLAEALLPQTRRSDRIEEGDISRPCCGKNAFRVLQKAEFSWIQISATRLGHREKSRRDSLAVTSRGGEQLRSITSWKTYVWVVRSIEHGAVGCSDPTGECRLDDRVNRVTGTRGSRVVGTVVVRWPAGTAEFGSRAASWWTNAAPRWSAGTRRRWWAPGGRTM